MSRRIRALIYHDVAERGARDEAGFAGRVAGLYKLDPASFERHLDAIVATGVQIAPEPSAAEAMLTFDDGGASALRVADRLEQRGLRGAFFVVTAQVGAPGFLSAAGVRELAGRGHLVGSHSHTHPPYMGRLAREVLVAEWRISRERLAELLGEEPACAAVPGGSTSRMLEEAAHEAGYSYLFTSTPTTRPRRRGRLTVLGRYTIWAADNPRTAASLIAGDPVLEARRYVAWQLKSGAKRVSPRIYDRARRLRAARA